MGITEIIFFTLILAGLYPFIIYPLILSLIRKIFKNRINIGKDFEPNITIITPVHNEERNIIPLVESIINSDYPTTKIQYIFGSDGSTDKTNELLEEVSKKHNFIEYYLFPKKGKNYIINQLVPKAKHEIIVFLDADIRITKETLHKLISYFNDEKVGGVLSNIIVSHRGKTEYTFEEKSTQKFFGRIRKWESDIYSTVNNNGPCYAIRKSFFVPIPNDKVCDDFFILLKIIGKGKRMIMAEDALVFDVRERVEVWKEYYRKMRFSAGGISTLFSVPEILLKPLILFFILSHKLLRWFSPFFILCALIFLLFTKLHLLKLTILILIIFTIFIFTIGLLNLYLSGKCIKILRIPMYVFFSIAGTIAGIFRALLGKQNSSWTLEGLVSQNEKT
ncbi:MAG: glycosyltransferase [Ignavibacteria bacterium]|nr:glycosyltransferase [Ignavibacteria bacterium]